MLRKAAAVLFAAASLLIGHLLGAHLYYDFTPDMGPGHVLWWRIVVAILAAGWIIVWARFWLPRALDLRSIIGCVLLVAFIAAFALGWTASEHYLDVD
ncbi:MAG: hypothetical protein Q8R02_11075 [Hyphomonadaceae bacterium]|nr:hypothetical protein [Hyphomonadaceae bacterium]